MALFVTGTNSYSEQVHVQGKIHTNPTEVSVVQADGHELERCLRLLAIEAPAREDGKVLRVVKFYGDQAKFITGNW